MPARGTEAGISDLNNGGEMAASVRRHLDRWRVYHFHDTSPSAPMRRTGDIGDNCFLKSDAGNLAAFLYVLRQRHSTCYELIRKCIQRVAPFFED
jgi:predicted ATPase